MMNSATRMTPLWDRHVRLGARDTWEHEWVLK